MDTLALVVIVRNEERCIDRCLSSAAAYVDELIVVDTGSTDRTKEIVRSHGISVYDYSWCDDFSAARNYALSLSSADWNLILDADEYVLDFQVDSIRQFMKDSTQLGRIQIISSSMVEGEESETRSHITRLLPSGVGYCGRIHEQVDAVLPRKNVAILIEHDGYLDTDKSARNIPLLLEELNINPEDSYYRYQLAKEYRGRNDWEQSLHYFGETYKALKGTESYAPNAVVDYVYVLIRLGRLTTAFEVLNAYAERLDSFPDYHFVCGIFFLDLILSDPDTYLSYLPRIEASYQRCLEIGETSSYESVVGTGSYAAWYNLGNYYEVFGQNEKARDCYQQAADLGYQKAIQQLSKFM